MPRKLPIESLLALADPNDPLLVSHLHAELKLFEPDEEVVAHLIELNRGIVSAEIENGSLAMHVACGNIENISIEILQRVINACPDCLRRANKFGMLPIHKAMGAFSTEKSLKGIRTIAEEYVEGLSVRSLDGQLPLHLALVSPKIYSFSLVELLVELHPDALTCPDDYGQFPLHKAACKVRTDPAIVNLLIEHSPKVAALKDNNG